jgi:hypothetical protein
MMNGIHITEEEEWKNFRLLSLVPYQLSFSHAATVLSAQSRHNTTTLIPESDLGHFAKKYEVTLDADAP